MEFFSSKYFSPAKLSLQASIIIIRAYSALDGIYFLLGRYEKKGEMIRGNRLQSGLLQSTRYSP